MSEVRKNESELKELILKYKINTLPTSDGDFYIIHENCLEDIFKEYFSNSITISDINDYGKYMMNDVVLGSYPDISFEEWIINEELQKRRIK